MKIEELKLPEINPRSIRSDRFRDLKESIEKRAKFLEMRPIIYDPETMEVIAGNMRVRALAELGHTEIPDEWIKSADD
jgi:ParB-like chromosome segregation protein Spo0J